MSIKEAALALGVELDNEEIKPGDLYLAERNTGPQLLTCREVKDNYIIPVEMAYCYDVWECMRIKP